MKKQKAKTSKSCECKYSKSKQQPKKVKTSCQKNPQRGNAKKERMLLED
jgi:hypothetical protein